MRNIWHIALSTLVAGTLVLGSAFVAYAASPPSVANAQVTTVQPVYADEFDGQLDTASWATLTPWNTEYTTGELGYYDSSEVAVSNGKLHLTSEDRPTGGRAYSSGIVTSLPRQKFSYGYFEIRAKLPKGAGIWPAFWLTNDKTLEIDVLELLGHRPDREYMTLHRNGRQIFQRTYTGPDFSAGYHTYGVDWQPTHIKWYVDGVLRAKYVHDIPSDPLWICLNTAVGGEWPGPPNASTRFPQSYDIDYVRVYDTMPASAKHVVAKKPAAAEAKPDADPSPAPVTESPAPATEPSGAPSDVATETPAPTETPAATEAPSVIAPPVAEPAPADLPSGTLIVAYAHNPAGSVETVKMAGLGAKSSPLLVARTSAFALARSITPRG